MERDAGWFSRNLTGRLWSAEPPGARRWRGVVRRALQVGWVVLRDVADGQLTLRAMSLVYTTLLSVVPLLALSFSVLKAFGVHNQIEPFVLGMLTPLGAGGAEVANRILGFVDNLKVGVLGSIGLALLLYTAISLIQKIEDSFNYIWHVTRLRPLSQRFSEYLSVILVGPVLIVAALGITASALNTSLMHCMAEIEPFGTAIWALGKLIPYLLVIGAFAFVYAFVPNTRVRVGPAAVGALIAGFSWETAGWAFAAFVVNSTRYTAIYSGFAILIMFMIWVYVSWLILLMGSSIAFYAQHPEYLTPRRRPPRLAPRDQERVGLSVMTMVARGYHTGSRPWTAEALVQALRVPIETLDPTLDTLLRAGYLVQAAQDPPAYLPARDPDTIPVAAILRTLREAGTDDAPAGLIGAADPVADAALALVDRAVEESLEGRTLRDLAAGAATDGPPASAAANPPLRAR